MKTLKKEVADVNGDLVDRIFRAWARVQHHHETGEWLPESEFILTEVQANGKKASRKGVAGLEKGRAGAV